MFHWIKLGRDIYKNCINCLNYEEYNSLKHGNLPDEYLKNKGYCTEFLQTVSPSYNNNCPLFKNDPMFPSRNKRKLKPSQPIKW